MPGIRNEAFAEESAEVEVLNANLSKLKNLTKKIQGSMSRLDECGRIVKDAIGPIYSNTQQLQVTHRNIDRVSEAIDRLRRPLDAKGREEGVIRAGPRQVGLQQYLAALKRVDRALKDLTNSNMRSNQGAISDFLGLLTIGHGQMQDLFRDMLKEEPRSVEPLHYIIKQLAFPVLASDKLSQLHQIGDAIASAAAHMLKEYHPNDNPAGRIYMEIRGKYLATSLENLATASINTSKRQAADSAIYREGTSGIGAYASGIEGMAVAENENVGRIFSREERGMVLEATFRNTLSHFASTLKELNNIIKSRIMSECFLAFEIVDLVTPLSYRLHSRTGQLKSQFTDALKPIRDTSRSSLTDILDQTAQQASSLTTLPNDGNTIPLVSETASRLVALSTSSRPVSSLLSSIGDGNWRTSSSLATSSQPSLLSIGPETENPTLLSHYLLDIIEALLSTLEPRAKTLHRSKSLQGCFLANSIAVLDRSIRSSTDLAMYLGISPHTAKLESWRRKAVSLYLDAWRETQVHLLDQITTKHNPSTSSNRPISGSATESAAIVKGMSSKEKDKKKEQFKAFNTSFDEMVARHKGLAMEKEVRAQLGKEVQGVIEPLYARFWDRYHEIDKGKGKVVKYDKAALAAVLAGLS